MIAAHDLSIGQRFAIGFALLFAVFAALAGSTYYWQSRSHEAQSAFTQRIAPLGRAAEILESDLLQAGIAVRAYRLRPDPERQRAYEARLAQVQASLERLRALPRQGEGEALFQRLAPHVIAYVEAARRMASGGEEAELAAARERAVSAIAQFADLQRTAADQALARVDDAAEGANRGLAVAGTLSLLLFGVLSLLITRSVRRPARRLLGAARALQGGDWKPALALQDARGAPAARRDEMLLLGEALGAAAAQLERREQRLRADRRVAEATSVSLEQRDIASAALQAACEHLGAEVGAFYSNENGTLRAVASRAVGGPLEPLAIGQGIPGQAAANLATVAVRDIPVDGAFSVKLGYGVLPPRAAVAVPVAFRGNLLGVLLVASLHELDAAAVGFLEAAASQLAVGLENARGYEQVRTLVAELEHKNELLQAQHEELQAQTEEIQAQNEELQAQGEEIQAQNEQLKGQAQQLKAYADSLAEADRRKSEFLGVLAHELRNPMAAIANSLHTLATSRKDEHRGRAQEVIGRQTRLLSRLVDDLLDVTRIASGKVQLQKEPTDVGEVVRECAEDYRAAAEKGGVEIEIAAPEHRILLHADRTRLCQIVGNLMDNAIKFSARGGRVRVGLHEADRHVEIVVQDDGMGMDDAMLARLFQPFSQADSSLARRKSGLGLGLALTKALAELHGGTVRAGSEGPGKGAMFIVRLPLDMPRAAAAEAEPFRGASSSRTGGGKSRRILIVEDNEDAGLSLKDALEDAGHQVRLAPDAEEALVEAQRFDPEVLLCDIGLPGMDGYALARALRKDPRFKAMFMIAVTGYAGPEDQRRAAQAGFDRHFRKPPDLELLHHLLAEVAPQETRPEASAS